MIGYLLFLRYFFQGFAYCFFDDGKRLFFFVYVIEGDEEVGSKHILMEAIGLTHESAHMVAFDCSFEKRFGRPYQHLGLSVRRLPRHA